MKESDFKLLRRMHNDLLEALKDLEACQCCVTCYYFALPGIPEPCRECRHQNKTTKRSQWRWRLIRKDVECGHSGHPEGVRDLLSLYYPDK